MKPLLIIALVCGGCEVSKQESKPMEEDTYWKYGIHEAPIKGHTYLLFGSGPAKGGIIHAEHCKCKEVK